MAGTYSLRELYQSLRSDSWRKGHPFSDDLATVNDLLFDTYATNGQREEQISNWLQRYQPCLFGRVAAAGNWLHFCVLTDNDLLTKSDEDISHIIRGELLAWKRRSLRPTDDFSTPAFGFVLVATSPHLANAAPDDRLQAFAHKLRELWGCEESQELSGTMHWETLYLRDLEAQRILQFRFSVDFFAAQGDGRWWHDHRSPGGLMFTANSVGHMQKYREWYLRMRDQRDWILQTAMLTIDEASTTPYGKATWLRTIGSSGRSVVEDVGCPFARPDRLKPQLVNKDWTKYGGWLHTDHSVRPEFFREDPAPIPDITAKEYLQDFTYLYRAEARDHVQFVQGEEVSPDKVVAEIGRVDDWKDVVHRRPKQTYPIRASELEVKDESADGRRVRALLERSRQWRLSPKELESLW